MEPRRMLAWQAACKQHSPTRLHCYPGLAGESNEMGMDRGEDAVQGADSRISMPAGHSGAARTRPRRKLKVDARLGDRPIDREHPILHSRKH